MLADKDVEVSLKTMAWTGVGPAGQMGSFQSYVGDRGLLQGFGDLIKEPPVARGARGVSPPFLTQAFGHQERSVDVVLAKVVEGEAGDAIAKRGVCQALPAGRGKRRPWTVIG